MSRKNFIKVAGRAVYVRMAGMNHPEKIRERMNTIMRVAMVNLDRKPRNRPRNAFHPTSMACPRRFWDRYSIRKAPPKVPMRAPMMAPSPKRIGAMRIARTRPLMNETRTTPFDGRDR